MRFATKFVLAVLLWAGAMLVLFVPITISTADGFTSVQLLRWLAHSLSLATLPAGIMVAGEVEAEPRRRLPVLFGLVWIVAFVVWAILGLVTPPLSGNGTPDFFRTLAAMRASTDSWEAYNHYAWLFTMTVSETVSTFLFAATGVQLGIWAPRVLPAGTKRLAYWVVAVGLLVVSYGLTDTLYESVVIRTNGPVEFVGLIGLLLPIGLCLGLVLPTLSALRNTATL